MNPEEYAVGDNVRFSDHSVTDHWWDIIPEVGNPTPLGENVDDIDF